MLDIVFTYVNTNSHKWIKERELTKQQYYYECENNVDGNIDHRFTDNDEIRYAFRSIEKYVKFDTKIYLVVSDEGQIPLWIDRQTINIIYHRDIIPSIYLPTFNSQVIELYIHKIKGLSDNFLYFNDDMMLGRNTTEKDFIENNQYKFYVCNEYSKVGIPNTKELGYRSAWKNGNRYLDRMFKIERRYKLNHCPVIINKIIYSQLLDIMNEEVRITSRSRFRSINDYNIICSIYPYFMYYTNQGILIQNENIINIFENEIERNKKYEDLKYCLFFCMNHYHERNTEILLQLFPIKSKYELIS